MELYLGGAFQGKLDYVKSLYNGRKIEIYGKDDFGKLCALENQDAIWNDFHLTIKTLLEKNESQDKITSQVFSIIGKNPEIKIISCEIGSGIVPIDKTDRLWRDFCGHLLVQLAQKADKVERIICGLPQRIK